MYWTLKTRAWESLMPGYVPSLAMIFQLWKLVSYVTVLLRCHMLLRCVVPYSSPAFFETAALWALISLTWQEAHACAACTCKCPWAGHREAVLLQEGIAQLCGVSDVMRTAVFYARLGCLLFVLLVWCHLVLSWRAAPACSIPASIHLGEYLWWFDLVFCHLYYIRLWYKTLVSSYFIH